MKVEDIPIRQIEKNPFQTRETPDISDIQILEDSINDHGLQNPITVRPHPENYGRYQVVSGERRLLACKRIGWETIPAIVKYLSNLEMAQLCLVENMQRVAINPIEEAKGYQILRQKFGHTPTEIARLIGKTRSYVSNRLRLLGLDYFVQACVLCKTIEASTALIIAGLPEGFQQYLVADLVIDWRLTYSETREIINEIKTGSRMFCWLRDVPVEGLKEFSSDRERPNYTNEELIESMRKHGQLQPIDVLVNGLIFDGRKRYYAAKLLGWDTLKARVWFMTDWLKHDPDAIIDLSPKKSWSSHRGIQPEYTPEEESRVTMLNRMLRAHIQGDKP